MKNYLCSTCPIPRLKIFWLKTLSFVLHLEQKLIEPLHSLIGSLLNKFCGAIKISRLIMNYDVTHVEAVLWICNTPLFIFFFICLWLYVCVCLCVSVCLKDRQWKRETEKEFVYVCCVCVCVRERERERDKESACVWFALT